MIVQLEYDIQLAFCLCPRVQKKLPFLGDPAFKVTLNKRKSNFFLITVAKLCEREYMTI